MPFFIAPLVHRQLIRIKGNDKNTFLQGLVTNDVGKVTFNSLLYAALLTPQGKFLNDLFITETAEGDWLIDCENPLELIKKLNLFKLRSAVELTLEDHYEVYAIWGERISDFHKNAADILIADPRLPSLGCRLYHQKGLPIASNLTNLEAYDRHRIMFGIADGSRDIPVQRGIILEYNFDELGAISWDKGCYIGQELIARTHYRGAIHKRLMTVNIEGNTPTYGASIYNNLHEEIGELRSAVQGFGLAMLRLSIFQLHTALTLDCEGAKITPIIPDFLLVNI